MTVPQKGWTPASLQQRHHYLAEFYAAKEKMERAHTNILGGLTLNRVLSKPGLTAEEEAQVFQAVHRLTIMLQQGTEM